MVNKLTTLTFYHYKYKLLQSRKILIIWKKQDPCIVCEPAEAYVNIFISKLQDTLEVTIHKCTLQNDVQNLTYHVRKYDLYLQLIDDYYICANKKENELEK